MIPHKFRVCEIFGIPIYLDISLAILLLLFATGGDIVSGLFCALMLLLSITAHELGHSLTARAFGYHTNDITLSLLGGCASLIALPRKAKQEFLTAIAGPAVSFAISFIGICGISLVASEGGFTDALFYVLEEVLNSLGIPVNFNVGLLVFRRVDWIVHIFLYVSVMNGMLGLFNLLPGFPMDGGRIFRSVMRAFMPRSRATYIAMLVGRGFAVLLALKAILSILSGGGWGFVTLMIAWMIWKEGYREYMQTLSEGEWGGWDFSARVSPPPYGGKSDETELKRER